MTTLTVKASPGGLVPKEFNPREHITDAETVDVPSTPYYRNLIREGSLVEAKDETVAEATTVVEVKDKTATRKPKPEGQA